MNFTIALYIFGVSVESIFILLCNEVNRFRDSAKKAL